MLLPYGRSKVGFPIRRSLDQSSFAAPQGLSQRTTSFIASQRQGIHQMLLRHLIALVIHGRSRPSRSHERETCRDQLVTKRPVMRTLSGRITVCLPNMTGADQLSLPHRHTFPLHDVRFFFADAPGLSLTAYRKTGIPD